MSYTSQLCSKTWLIQQKSMIQNIVLFRIFFWTDVPRKKNAYNCNWLFWKPWYIIIQKDTDALKIILHHVKL